MGRKITLLCLIWGLAPVLGLAPGVARGSDLGGVLARVAHISLRPGSLQTVSLTAKDLSGKPLVRASVSATVSYASGSARQTLLSLPRTNGAGNVSFPFRVPSTARTGSARVHLDVKSGYLQESKDVTFQVAGARSTAGKPVSTPEPTSLPAKRQAFKISPRILTVTPVAPQPVWLAVTVRSTSGQTLAGVLVTALSTFAEGPVVSRGTTDATGVATLSIDTSLVHGPEHVGVHISVQFDKAKGAASAKFDVSAAAAFSTPTVVSVSTPPPTVRTLPASSPTVQPTSLPTATETFVSQPNPGVATSVPVTQPATETPTPIVPLAASATPTPTGAVFASAPTATPTTLPTSTPLPTATPAPVPTSTPFYSITSTPTWTPTPLPTATSTQVAPTPTQPTATPIQVVPTPTQAAATPTPAADCPGTQSGCMQAALNLINATRAQYGLRPLSLNLTESNGTGSCIGSYGHSVHMAQMGQISHDQFPADICVPYSYTGENVGEMGGNELSAIQWIHNTMMSEPHDPATCASSTNHACNILSPSFTQVGIGLYFDGSITWYTTDFLG